MKDFLRKITPNFLLEWNRSRKKANRNKELDHQKEEGGISKEMIKADLERVGVQQGDSVLVHSSLSRIGYLEEGPQTLVDALLDAVGSDGTILMPTSPNAGWQLDYIKELEVFDVRNTPSRTGKITEYFRTLPGVLRSIHPTEPVSALGSKADFFTSGHFGQLTAYNENSPFARLSQMDGKILYIGVTLSMAGTNLHTLEDAVDFKFPVYYDEVFEVNVIDAEGQERTVKTKVHNPQYSKKRKCDDLIPMFEKHGVLRKVKIGEADSLIVDAKGFLEVMIEEYEKNGVTMYTPFGS